MHKDSQLQSDDNSKLGASGGLSGGVRGALGAGRSVGAQGPAGVSGDWGLLGL